MQLFFFFFFLKKNAIWQKKSCMRHCVESVQIPTSFGSIFSRIWTECGKIRSISSYSVRMRKNTDQSKLRIYALLKTKYWFCSSKMQQQGIASYENMSGKDNKKQEGIRRMKGHYYLEKYWLMQNSFFRIVYKDKDYKDQQMNKFIERY